MVVNDKYRFIFVHVPKSGGTSMMRVLRKLEGDNRRWVSRATKHETLEQFARHLPSRRHAGDMLRGRFLRRYYIFGFVRNPWDRIASLYCYLKEHRPRVEVDSIGSFAEFLDRAEAGEPWIRQLHSMRPQCDFFIGQPQTIRVDFVGHMEFLAEDFDAVMSRLGIHAQLPHANRSSNSDRDYRRAYSPRMVDIVGSLFASDVEAFGYTFETPEPQRRCSGRLPASVIQDRQLLVDAAP